MDQSSEMDKFTCSAPVGWIQYRFRQRTCDAQQTERHKHFRSVHHRFSLWEQAGHSERNAVERNLMM